MSKGFRKEVNLQVISWMKEVSLSLQKGYIITVDYGSLSSELYNNRRGCGTLLCYHKHQKNDNPYQFIGKLDITTHINFSALS